MELDTFKAVNINGNSLRMSQELQRILIINCGLNTGQIKKIVERMNLQPQSLAPAQYIGSKVGGNRIAALLSAPQTKPTNQADKSHAEHYNDNRRDNATYQ